jgi:hypothetical protein
MNCKVPKGMLNQNLVRTLFPSTLWSEVVSVVPCWSADNDQRR